MTLTDTAHRRHRRLRVGRLWVDAVSFDEALSAIESLVDAGKGGAVYTPNVDHVVKAESNEAFRRTYRRRQPVVGRRHASGVGEPPSRMSLAGTSGGVRHPHSADGARRETAMARLPARQEVREPRRPQPNVSWMSSAYPLSGGMIAESRRTVQIRPGLSAERARAARPDVILVGLGPPKQELWIDRYKDTVGPTVALAIGAGLDFLAGRFSRAPRWVANSGFEWAYRLLLEPRRLYRRYLIESPKFISIVFSTWMAPISERITEVSGRSDVQVPPPPSS